jgi:hypothetical protein
MTAEGLAALNHCRDHLATSYFHAWDAAGALAGARETRARELADRIADAIAHVDRLTLLVTADHIEAGGVR